MNERVRQLAEQQGLTGPNFLISSQELEKFAELIVRECYGEVLCQLYDYNPSSNEQFNLGHEAGLKLAVSKIKQHFEVEDK